MRVFLYEFVTGGGLFCSADSLSKSLLGEGRAMISALAEDFLKIDSCNVVSTRDRRQAAFHPEGCDVYEVSIASNERALVSQLANEADWTIVIAPELDGHLFERTRWVEESGGRLLGPSSKLVELTSDKQRTAEHLARSGVSTPESARVDPGEPLPNDFSYPAVIKPLDGTGSTDTRLVSSPDDPSAEEVDRSRPVCLEEYCPGVSASVAFLCGPTGQVAMPPCRQRLSEDGRFNYLGGSFTLSQTQAERAVRLAQRAVRSLGNTVGYLGVDLVLSDRTGDQSDSPADVVLEINPRLTTSYVGLRKLTTDNLALAMRRIAEGKGTSIEFGDKPLEFDADGSSCLSNSSST